MAIAWNVVGMQGMLDYRDVGIQGMLDYRDVGLEICRMCQYNIY